MSRFDQFLAEVASRHGKHMAPEALSEAIHEIRLHLEDSRSAFLCFEMSPQDAEDAAIKAFGDPRPAMPPKKKLVSWSLGRRSWLAAAGFLFYWVSVMVCLGSSYVTGPLEWLFGVGAGIAMLAISGGLRRQIFPGITLLLYGVLFFLIWVPSEGGHQRWMFPAPVSNERQMSLFSSNAEVAARTMALQTVKDMINKAEVDPSNAAYSREYRGKVRYPRSMTLYNYTPVLIKIDPDYQRRVESGRAGRLDTKEDDRQEFFSSKEEASAMLIQEFPKKLPQLESKILEAKANLAVNQKRVNDPVGNYLDVAKSLSWTAVTALCTLLFELFGVFVRGLFETGNKIRRRFRRT
ncbi:MAG: hypothetical protein ABUL72_01755 [Armatimonadota bacterium]